MKINPISNNYYLSYVSTKKEVKPEKKKKLSNNSSFNNIAFGWCVPHITATEGLNEKFLIAIKNFRAKELGIIQNIENLNVLKNTRYSLLDNAAAEATALFSKYCNTQYTVAEMLPSYALSLNKPLLDSIKELDVFKDPVKLLIAINNVTKLEMVAGIDKNTGKQYTAEETNKAKSGTQLYVVTILMEHLKNKINAIENNENKKYFVKLYESVNSSIDKIYGENAINRILELSKIGKNPTYDQKVASLNLIKEFDEKAKNLSLADDFEKELQELINKENLRLGKTIENDGVGLNKNIAIKLAYHTHHNQVHTHHNHTPHGQMSEEAHRLFHLQEMEKKLKQEQHRK